MIDEHIYLINCTNTQSLNSLQQAHMIR